MVDFVEQNLLYFFNNVKHTHTHKNTGNSQEKKTSLVKKKELRDY